MASSSVATNFLEMAFSRNFGSNMRNYVLVAFLILITYSLTLDKGVNGEKNVEEPKNSGEKQNPEKTGPIGKIGKVTVEKLERDKKLNVEPPAIKGAHSDSKPSSTRETLGNSIGQIGKPSAGEQSPETVKKDKNIEVKEDKNTDVKEEKNTDVKQEKNDKVKKQTSEKGTEEKKEEVDEDDGEEEVHGTKSKDTEADWRDMFEDEQMSAEIKLNQPGNIFDKSEKNIKLGQKSDGTSSSGSFMTYFVIAAVFVVIIYLIFHNKKKLMAYIVEGRNTGRTRRHRATASSGTEYKPLKDAEETNSLGTA